MYIWGVEMLELCNITLHYGQSQILNGVSLNAEKGKVTCLMGTNGVGKTSLLKAISGTHSHSDGSYKLNGKEQGISSCLLYTSPSPRDGLLSRMPSSA